MIRHPGFLLLLLVVLMAAPAAAQSDPLNLPADLYVLVNEGVVRQYPVEGGVRTVTPDDRFVVDFGVDATGTRIAYRTPEGLFLAPVDDPAAAQLVDMLADVPPLRGRGDTIAWSANGDAIAYTTQTGARVYFTALGVSVSVQQAGLLNLVWSPDGQFFAAGAEHDIWWIYRRNGTSPVLHAAIPSSRGMAWLSGDVIAFAPARGGMLRMALSEANAQAPLAADDQQYILPVVTPDGALLAFHRNPRDTSLPAGYGTLIRLEQGPPAETVVLGRETIDLNGNLRWGPRAALMVALEGGIVALFDPATGEGIPLPMTGVVGYAWGPSPARGAEATPEATAEATTDA